MSKKSWLERLDPKIQTSPGCWLWTAGLTKDGYGQFWHEGRNRKAHRLVYELLVGQVPEGLQLDHLCRNRHCVNPAHVEPVTQVENMRRGRLSEVRGQYNRDKQACPKGHPYAYKSTSRRCRECTLASNKRSRDNKRNIILQERKLHD